MSQIVSTHTDGPHTCGLVLPTVLEDEDNDYGYKEQGVFPSWHASSTLVDETVSKTGGSTRGGAKANFWWTENDQGGTFRIDLGCSATVTEVHLRNLNVVSRNS